MTEVDTLESEQSVPELDDIVQSGRPLPDGNPSDRDENAVPITFSSLPSRRATFLQSLDNLCYENTQRLYQLGRETHAASVPQDDSDSDLHSRVLSPMGTGGFHESPSSMAQRSTPVPEVTECFDVVTDFSEQEPNRVSVWSTDFNLCTNALWKKYKCKSIHGTLIF